MLCKKRTVVGFVILCLLVWGGVPLVSGAQAEQVTVAINGDPTIDGSRVSAAVSVTGPEGAITDLPPDAFAVTEAGQPVSDLTVEPFPAGVGVVIVVDRGGIAEVNGCAGPTDNNRITEAEEMARTFVEQLVIDDPSRPDDMVALIGIGDENADDRTEFWPDQNFTFNPVDRNLVLNELEFLDAPERLLTRGTTTPLYEGLDRALDWLRANGDPTVRQELARRHKLVLVFSDGIDQEYSDDAVELGIIDKAREADVNIYSVGLGCDSGRTRLIPDSLRHLSAQTNGKYWEHDTAGAHEQVLSDLVRLLDHSQQYRLSFTTTLPGGEYTLRVRAETPQGADEDEASFFSPLRPPRLTITNPPAGVTITETRALTTTLPVTATVSFPDGIERDVTMTFLVDGAPVHTTTGPPYRYDWGLASLEPARHMVMVQATDSLLQEEVPLEAERSIEIISVPPTPVPTESPPIPPVPGGTDTGTVGNLLLWLIVPLVIAVIVLVVLLFRTQRQVRDVVAGGVRQVTTRLTQVLPSLDKPARAKLSVIRGPAVNREYRIREQETHFGRDQSVCDEVIDDSFVSSDHFSITFDSDNGNFWIADQGSRNGTYVNGQRIAPNQYVPLRYGYGIRVGETEMVFQRIGGTTRVLRGLE